MRHRQHLQAPPEPTGPKSGTDFQNAAWVQCRSLGSTWRSSPMSHHALFLFITPKRAPLHRQAQRGPALSPSSLTCCQQQLSIFTSTAQMSLKTKIQRLPCPRPHLHHLPQPQSSWIWWEAQSECSVCPVLGAVSPPPQSLLVKRESSQTCCARMLFAPACVLMILLVSYLYGNHCHHYFMK